eukprot:612435-Pyramimonas_sp.AAC.1
MHICLDTENEEQVATTKCIALANIGHEVRGSFSFLVSWLPPAVLLGQDLAFYFATRAIFTFVGLYYRNSYDRQRRLELPRKHGATHLVSKGLELEEYFDVK